MYDEQKEAPEETLDEKKKDLLKQSKISMILNNYDDIFSDFDPRSFTDRALSHDFLLEAKNASHDKSLGTIELSFLIPSHLRNTGEEFVIKKRLHDHFRKHQEELKREIKHTKMRGLRFAITGACLGAIATFITVASINTVLKSALVILLEPASWFSIWTGFDYIFFVPHTEKTELAFYQKMEKAQITFHGY